MDSESSNDYSYEDDFEIPESILPQGSTKVSVNTNSPNLNRFEYKKNLQRKRYKSHETTKSPSRVDSTRKFAKKNFKTVEKENQQLRNELKAISKELSNIVQFAASRQHFRPKISIKSRDVEETNSNKLQIYVNEYCLVKEKFDNGLYH